MTINPYSIPPLFAAILALIFGTIVLTRNPRSSTSRSFFFLYLSTFIWLSFYAVNFTLGSSHDDLTQLLFRISYCGVIFLAPSYLHFLTEFLEIRAFPIRAILYINYLLAILFSFLTLKTDVIIQDIQYFFWGPYPQAGQFHPIFLINFIIAIVIALLILTKEIFNNKRSVKQQFQIRYILLGYLVFGLACFDFMANYGIAIYPFGYIPATIFFSITAYCILKYNLLDINIVIKKSFIYSVLIAFITFSYLICVLVLERMTQSLLGYNNHFNAGAVVILIALLATPIKNKIQEFIDLKFIKGNPVDVAEENTLLRKEIADREKFKAVSQLASSIAHEIRNPLTTLKTFNEFLPENAHDVEFIKKHQRLIQQELSRIEGLASNLLDFSKPTPPQLKQVNLKDLIEETLDLISHKLKSNQISLLKELVQISINLDPGQMKQALLNLILNAIDAMPNGGTLNIRTTSHERQVTITISDTGCGIDSKDLPHIFDPFYSKKEKGTGLGLAITKGIIEEHNGKINVASRLNEWTTFIITLPLKGFL